MSVPTWKRNESEILYLENARTLNIYTLRVSIRFPKRYMFVITQRLIALAGDVYDNAKRANTIDPKDNKAMQDKRLGFLADAICSVQALSSEIDIARGVVKCFMYGNDPAKQKTKPIPPKVWQTWGEMINREFNLLKATYNSFYEKYKQGVSC